MLLTTDEVRRGRESCLESGFELNLHKDRVRTPELPNEAELSFVDVGRGVWSGRTGGTEHGH